jgi:hypothetical protein
MICLTLLDRLLGSAFPPLHKQCSIRQYFSFCIDPASEYLSHAVISICEKGTSDSQLFLAALDTLISIVTDPICQLRMYFTFLL